MNEPAFPTKQYNRNIMQMETRNGMTLRDYFAAKAIQGMNARDSYDAGQASPEQRARLAYIEADAMLKARGNA